MEFKELLDFVDVQDERLNRDYSESLQTQKEKILARTVKLTEELGELCDEVLSFNGDQRKEKLESRDESNLSHEFADVILTTLLLAKVMNVDISEALEKKIEKLNARYD